MKLLQGSVGQGGDCVTIYGAGRVLVGHWARRGGIIEGPYEEGYVPTIFLLRSI